MLLRRGVLAALTALLVAAPSAVALSAQSDPSTSECVANCSDSSASSDAPTTDTESPSDTRPDDGGSQKGDDGASTPAEPGGETDGDTGNTGGDDSGDNTINLCEFEPWNNPRCGNTTIDLCKWEPWNFKGCGDSTTPPPGCDGCETPTPIECNYDGKRRGPNVCHPLNPCAAEAPEQDPKCITDPTVDPPALPACDVDSTDGETYCSLPWTPCKFKPSTGEKICPPVDPPVDCTTARFASEEAAAAAGCGPSVEPPATSGIRVCKTDKETGERSCRSLERGEYGCFETEDGPWICVDPAPEPPVLCDIDDPTGCEPTVYPPAPDGIRVCKTDKETGERSCRSLERGEYGCFETEDGPSICVCPPHDPPVLCNINEANSEHCYGPIDGGGCFKTEGGETACYDRLVLNPKPPLVKPKPSVIQPKGKPTAGKPQKQAKGPKSRSQSAKGKQKKNAKAKPKANGNSKGKGKAKAKGPTNGKGKANGKAKGKAKAKAKLKSKRAPARSAR